MRLPKDEKSEIMANRELTTTLKAHAHRLGFDLAGIRRADFPATWDRFLQWLEEGRAANMHYIVRRREAYKHPNHILPGVKSLVMLGLNYRTVEPAGTKPGFGAVSPYAWGTDYHAVAREKLKALGAFLRTIRPEAKVRGVVDTAPLLERDSAHAAGLGWFGKNTTLINDTYGSRFFIAALLTDVELEPDSPAGETQCGDCDLCLKACPTGALVAPYTLDARKCLNYWTIEAKEPIPREIREKLDDRFFGCDVCQDVCPYNANVPKSNEPAFQPRDGLNPVDLVSLFDLDEEAFRARFRETPLWRAKRSGLLRNAAAVLTNRPTPEGQAALNRGLEDDDAEVRAACAEALFT